MNSRGIKWKATSGGPVKIVTLDNTCPRGSYILQVWVQWVPHTWMSGHKVCREGAARVIDPRSLVGHWRRVGRGPCILQGPWTGNKTLMLFYIEMTLHDSKYRDTSCINDVSLINKCWVYVTIANIEYSKGFWNFLIYHLKKNLSIWFRTKTI